MGFSNYGLIMAATETPLTKLADVDGRIISESAAGLVRVEITASPLVPLVAGDAVAFRPIEDNDGQDRFLGTVVSVSGDSEATLLLDRVALTMALTTEQQEVSPFAPVPSTHEYGLRYF